MNKKKPNIVFIITDQQRYDTINALGFPFMQTPALDRLVNEGVSFDRCYVNAPSCGPSRASLFTGFSPHVNGALRNQENWPRTWVADLADAGYRCVNLGKMHSWPPQDMHGFHERYPVENKQRHYAEKKWTGNPFTFKDEWDKQLAARGHRRLEKGDFEGTPGVEEKLGAYEWWYEDDEHPDVFVGDMAVRWIDEAPDEAEEPWFLEVGFPGPHPPYDPIERYTEHYMQADLPIQPVTQEEMDGQPKALQGLRENFERIMADSIHFVPDAPMEWRHRQRAYYLANITMIDEKVGEIMEALERRGRLDDTVIIFTSDHGDLMGDHGLAEKWVMYENSVRVPLVFWAPDRFAQNIRQDGLCQWFDIGPTILELAGATVSEHIEAQSLLSGLTGDGFSGRQYVFSEHMDDPVLNTVECELMIRDKRWKLVEYIGPNEGQLFDLENDPDELNDLWSDEQHAQKREELHRKLHDWYIAGSNGIKHARKVGGSPELRNMSFSARNLQP